MTGFSPATHKFQPWRIVGWGAVLVALLVPAVAMQFDVGVNWGSGDFVLAAALLGLAGVGIELAARMSGTALRRGFAVAAILGFLLVIWAEMAVGLF